MPFQIVRNDLVHMPVDAIVSEEVLSVPEEPWEEDPPNDPGDGTDPEV